MMEESYTHAGYFMAILAVVGGTLLMPPFPVFFATIGPLLLVLLAPVLLISIAQHRRKKQQTAHVLCTQGDKTPQGKSVMNESSIAEEQEYVVLYSEHQYV